MTKRITIKSGDYILLSDIPNEQVFNLVKECFVNAGHNSVSVWEEHAGWSAFYAHSDGYICHTYSCFVFKGNANCLRQLSLSDVFNSTNGRFDWHGNTVLFIDLPSGDFTAIVKEQDYRHETPDTYKISKAFSVDILQQTDIKHMQGRAIGKSTAHHLELISKAMKSPEQWVEVYCDQYDTAIQNVRALNVVESLCYKLGLDWMEFSVSGNSIRYMPYQTVKVVTKWERVK